MLNYLTIYIHTNIKYSEYIWSVDQNCMLPSTEPSSTDDKSFTLPMTSLQLPGIIALGPIFIQTRLI